MTDDAMSDCMGGDSIIRNMKKWWNLCSELLKGFGSQFSRKYSKIFRMPSIPGITGIIPRKIFFEEGLKLRIDEK